MFEFAIIPLIFLLSAVTADICEFPRTPCTPNGGATQDELNGIIFRCYTGNSMDNYIDAPANDTQRIWEILDTTQPLCVHTHGWLSHNTTSNTETRTAVIGAILATRKCTGCEMLWSILSCNPSYFSAAGNVCAVGKVLGGFLNDYKKNGGDYSKIHLTGHSLGSHVSGHAGRETDSPVKSIFGIDSAGPLFTDPNKCLNKCCAETVHNIHSDGLVLGNSATIAHADHLPNGGIANQPMCNATELYRSPTCNHMAAANYLHAIIVSPSGLFIGRQCDSMNNFNNGKCNSNPKVNITWPPPATTPSGTYYFVTSGTDPYGLGEAGATRPSLIDLVISFFG